MGTYKRKYMWSSHKDLKWKDRRIILTSLRRLCMASSKHQERGMQGLMDTFRKMSSREVRVILPFTTNKKILIPITSLYVADLLYMCSSSKMTNKFKVDMMNEFEMKDLGIMKYFLGMEVYQSKDDILICQTKYA